MEKKRNIYLEKVFLNIEGAMNGLIQAGKIGPNVLLQGAKLHGAKFGS